MEWQWSMEETQGQNGREALVVATMARGANDRHGHQRAVVCAEAWGIVKGGKGLKVRPK